MSEPFNIKNYENFLGDFKEEGAHWEKMHKRTATLFGVLIDKDLRELVFVLRHYKEYIKVACDHFRYLYNYSEQTADIYAASELLSMSEGYHQKQFVRNLLNKLERIDTYDVVQLKAFIHQLIDTQERLHPIIVSFYKESIIDTMNKTNIHILQRKALEKLLVNIQVTHAYDFSASDRDAQLEIPYMH